MPLNKETKPNYEIEANNILSFLNISLMRNNHKL